MAPRLLPLGALLLLALLAGCSAAGSITMDPVTDDEIAERASRGFDPGDRTDLDAEARMLVDALENGSGTIESPSPPVEEGLPFAYGGAYYDLSWAVVDDRTATSVSLVVDYNTSNAEGERIAYEDLPGPDRRAVAGLFPPRDDTDREGYDFGSSAIYNDSELARSVLAPDQRYDVVVYEGEAYPIKLDGTREVELRTYRYTSSKVADGPEEYAGDLKDRYLFTLSGLSDAERDVVEEAIDGGYYAEDTDDEAFGAVVERFRRHEPVESEEGHGEWLVRYDGEVYWADLWYDGFEVGSGSAGRSGSGSERTEPE